MNTLARDEKLLKYSKLLVDGQTKRLDAKRLSKDRSIGDALSSKIIVSARQGGRYQPDYLYGPTLKGKRGSSPTKDRDLFKSSSLALLRGKKVRSTQG